MALRKEGKGNGVGGSELTLNEGEAEEGRGDNRGPTKGKQLLEER